MKNSVITILFLTISLSVVGQDFMINVYGRQNITFLNGNWEIITDFYNYGQKRKIYKNLKSSPKIGFVEYSFDPSQTLHVPGDWNSQKPEFLYYESSIWYKKEFDYNLACGKRLFVYFGAVNFRASVFLNGEYLGTHEGGYTPFQFEITDKVKEKGNFLIVEVNNTRKPEQIPSVNYDWWNFGGITRDVVLIETPIVYIDDYFFRLSRDGFSIEANVVLSDKLKGKTVNIKIPKLNFDNFFYSDDSGRINFSFKPGKRFKRWSPGKPVLYDIIISTEDDFIKDNIGFRTITVSGTKIMLNGEPIFLKGVNCHDEIADRKGRAYSNKDASYLLAQVKELGCNFVRLTHYPPSEQLVHEAEKLGFLLFEEIPQWQNIDFGNPYTDSLAKSMMAEMIKRDKNRCSIIAWSLANETSLTSKRDSSLLVLLDYAKKLDNSRLFTAVTNKVEYNAKESAVVTKDRLFKYLDLFCVNKYFGWYTPWPCNPKDMVWNCYPDKPLVVTEFGGEALYGSHGLANNKSDWNEECQEKIYKDCINMFENIPNLSGIAPWCLYDFRSPYRMNSQYQKGWNRKGLLSDFSEKKRAWYVIHKYYSSK